MPQAKQDGAGRIIITVPNGDATVEIAMTASQALGLGELASREACKAIMVPEPESVSAVLHDFPRPKASPRRRVQA